MSTAPRGRESRPADATWTDADFVGGHAALDFVNTVADVDKCRTTTRLPDWNALASWHEAAASRHDGDPLPLPDPGENRRGRVLGRLHVLRERAFGLLDAVAHGGSVDGETSAAIERAIATATGRATLHVDREGGRWRTTADPSHHPVDRFALQLDDLLRGGELGRLRECGLCTWLYLDHGRGAGRRWCDMRTCGNRAKAQAFRQRAGMRRGGSRAS